MKKVLKEWFLNASWGKIALISWGDPNGDPVLLVHGRLDSAATFLPLLEHLPETYHYVAVDLPGNGLSDPLPIGLLPTRLFPVVVVDMVVEHMNWMKFTYIAHSMGTELGLFYNAIYPGKIKRCIYLDGVPAIKRLLIPDYSLHYKLSYLYYYDNYDSINKDNRIYSKEAALKAVMKARGLSKAQAEIILSRNLRKVGNDQYKLSWDNRQKVLAPMFNSPEFYYELFSQIVPPTLLISASQSDAGFEGGKEAAKKLVSDLEKNVRNFRRVSIDAGHDLHFTDPEITACYVLSFLQEDSGRKKSKL